MLKTNFFSLSKEQFNLLLKPEPFALLRKAKLIISIEFSKDLALHSKDVLNNIYTLSKESKDERLFDIYNNLQQYIEIEPQAVPSMNEKVSIVTNTSISPKPTKINIGDIVDGKRCSGFYRGQPVFNDN